MMNEPELKTIAQAHWDELDPEDRAALRTEVFDKWARRVRRQHHSDQIDQALEKIWAKVPSKKREAELARAREDYPAWDAASVLYRAKEYAADWAG